MLSTDLVDNAPPVTTVLAVVGNPRAQSRTHLLAHTLAAEIARVAAGWADAHRAALTPAS
jgi:hypothetical protein